MPLSFTSSIHFHSLVQFLEVLVQKPLYLVQLRRHLVDGVYLLLLKLLDALCHCFLLVFQLTLLQAVYQSISLKLGQMRSHVPLGGFQVSVFVKEPSAFFNVSVCGFPLRPFPSFYSLVQKFLITRIVSIVLALIASQVVCGVLPCVVRNVRAFVSDVLSNVFQKRKFLLYCVQLLFWLCVPCAVSGLLKFRVAQTVCLSIQLVYLLRQFFNL